MIALILPAEQIFFCMTFSLIKKILSPRFLLSTLKFPIFFIVCWFLCERIVVNQYGLRNAIGHLDQPRSRTWMLANSYASCPAVRKSYKRISFTCSLTKGRDATSGIEEAKNGVWQRCDPPGKTSSRILISERKIKKKLVKMSTTALKPRTW